MKANKELQMIQLEIEFLLYGFEHLNHEERKLIDKQFVKLQKKKRTILIGHTVKEN